MPLNFDKLTDQQVYSLSKNKSLSKTLRREALAALTLRARSVEEVQVLATAYEQSPVNKKIPLPVAYRIVLVIFPFFVPVQVIIAALFFKMTNTWKWKQFWLYLAIGWVLWMVIFFYIATRLLDEPGVPTPLLT